MKWFGVIAALLSYLNLKVPKRSVSVSYLLGIYSFNLKSTSLFLGFQLIQAWLYGYVRKSDAMTWLPSQRTEHIALPIIVVFDVSINAPFDLWFSRIDQKILICLSKGNSNWMLKKSVNRSDIQVSYFDTYRFHEYFKNMFFFKVKRLRR